MLESAGSEERWMDVDEAADYYGVVRRTIYKYCATGELVYHRAPRGRRFLMSDLDDLIRNGRVESRRGAKRRG